MKKPRSVAEPAPSPRRQWLFRLGALFLAPLALLTFLEIALRIVGIGHHTGFFERFRIGQREFLVNNEDFSLRFFPPQLARWPGPIMIEAKKPADTCRIFIMGESAARGEPEPPYSAARYMEVLLRQRFPARKFEVVNVAITAINSHVILPIARDCAREGGDFWIVYMGNNEMVGPFGAATVFGSRATPLCLVRLSLAAQRLRLGQLLMSAARGLKGKDRNASWGGMKMFLGNQLRPDDPRKAVVYQSFQRNLDDILRAGLDSGATVMLNTVAVNLKDCPPFASLSGTNLSTAQSAACDGFIAEGSKAEDEGRFTDAARSLEQAAALDPTRADIQFRWAECLFQMGRTSEAATHFQSACDNDALPFRADSRINGIIRDAGRQFAGPRLALLDAAAAFATNIPSGVPGAESFYEHVHFNFDGNYRLGRAWAEQIGAQLSSKDKASAPGATNEWASQADCDRRLGLTDWNRESVVLAVTERLHRPPLSGQSNNARRLAALQADDKRLRGGINRGTEAQARQGFIDAIQVAPDDHWLRENFAEFLESCGDLKGATVQWQAACDLLPRNSVAYYQLGRLLEQQQQWAQAESALLRATAIRPRLVEAWCELGNAHLAQERADLALDDYERAWRLNPEDSSYCAFTAKALGKLNRHEEAIARYREALRLSPDFWEVHFALGEEMALQSRLAEAEAEYEEVIKLQPAYVPAHLSAGVMLARQGQFDAALSRFEDTLRLDPGNKLALEYKSRVQGWKQHRP